MGSVHRKTLLRLQVRWLQPCNAFESLRHSASSPIEIAKPGAQYFAAVQTMASPLAGMLPLMVGVQTHRQKQLQKCSAMLPGDRAVAQVRCQIDAGCWRNGSFQCTQNPQLLWEGEWCL